jgi:hypothetical protein
LLEVTEELLNLYLLDELVLNRWFRILGDCIIPYIQVSLQLPLYYDIMNLIEVVLLVYIVYLGLETLYCILPFIVKLFMLVLLGG